MLNLARSIVLPALLQFLSGSTGTCVAHFQHCLGRLQVCWQLADMRASGCLPSSGHNYIGTEHILLGLLREGEGVAARVLETLGADPSKIRTQVCFQSLLCMRHVQAQGGITWHAVGRICIAGCPMVPTPGVVDAYCNVPVVILSTWRVREVAQLVHCCCMWPLPLTRHSSLVTKSIVHARRR